MKCRLEDQKIHGANEFSTDSLRVETTKMQWQHCHSACTSWGKQRSLEAKPFSLKESCYTNMCHGQGCRVFWGMGDLPPLIGILNPYNGYINPYNWVDDHPLLYGNVMGVDRPDRTYVASQLTANFRFQSLEVPVEFQHFTRKPIPVTLVTAQTCKLT